MISIISKFRSTEVTDAPQTVNTTLSEYIVNGPDEVYKWAQDTESVVGLDREKKVRS